MQGVHEDRIALWRELWERGEAGRVCDEIVRSREVPDRLIRVLSNSGPRGKVLTRRGRQCTYLASIGMSSREIGRVLGVTKDTVEEHIEKAMIAIGVGSRTELVAWAIRTGEIV